MSLFVHVELLHDNERREPVVVPGREKQLTPIVGVTKSTMHRIIHPPNDHMAPQTLGVFAFTDLSVRQEGRYRLRFHLYEIRDAEGVHLTFVDSDAFQVYPAKGFPGMEQSTMFTDLLKKHGIKVRVSKSIRMTKKNTQVEPESSPQKFAPEGDAQRRIQVTSNVQYSSPDWVPDTFLNIAKIYSFNLGIKWKIARPMSRDRIMDWEVIPLPTFRDQFCHPLITRLPRLRQIRPLHLNVSAITNEPVVVAIILIPLPFILPLPTAEATISATVIAPIITTVGVEWSIVDIIVLVSMIVTRVPLLVPSAPARP